MRSPASSPRAWLEGALHTVAVVLLGAAAFSAWREQSRGGSDERARSAGLDSALIRWSTATAPIGAELVLQHPITLVQRDWLAALPGAGTRVRWTGAGLVATAFAVIPSADPLRNADLLVAAPSGVPVITGAVRRDTARVSSGLLRLSLPEAREAVALEVGGLEARAPIADSLDLRRLLILGRAGWEAKFVMAALEERGWQVDVHLALAPGADVGQGISPKAGGSPPAAPAAEAPAPGPPPSGRAGTGMRTFAQRVSELAGQRSPVVTTAASTAIAIDTSRYAAVLAIDSTAAREAGRIARFVRSGGGLILWPEAADAEALQALAPGQNRPADLELTRHSAGVVTMDSLALRALLSLKPDAVVLAQRGAEVTLAARRVGPGRVLQLGFEDLWRWRMAGGPDAARSHREWLARAVAGIAMAPRHDLDRLPGDAAPLAALVDRLGPGAPASLPLSAAIAGLLNVWTFSLLSVALLTEWLSRRLRSRP